MFTTLLARICTHLLISVFACYINTYVGRPRTARVYECPQIHERPPSSPQGISTQRRCICLRTDVTSYPNHSALKQHVYYLSSGSPRSEMGPRAVDWAAFPLEALREIIPCLGRLLEAPPSPAGLLLPPLHLQPPASRHSDLLPLSLVSTLWLCRATCTSLPVSGSLTGSHCQVPLAR